MTSEEEIARAREVELILSNRYVREALDDIKAALVEQWSKTPVKDTDLRERIWAIFLGAVKFEELLKSHIETGKMAVVQQKRGITDFFRAA